MPKTKSKTKAKPKKTMADCRLTHGTRLQTLDDVQFVRSLAISGGKPLSLGYTITGGKAETHFAMPDGTIKTHRH